MPIKSGRIVKTKKTKGGTEHQKNHRWESFSSKVEKLQSLGPIRRPRRHDLDEDLSTRNSYLRVCLEKWQELNTSQDFLTLNHELRPLCDSLPQILHFEDKIMELLVKYIEGYINLKEKHALQPALDLLKEYAHDLGVRFEKHYAKSIELVTAIIVTPGDVEVIEWSRDCLVFLFKYLSKLLVPDLRPTFDLMAPLLGKLRQQPHTAKFAGEAMSFLVQKAAAPSYRDTALPLIINHAKKDLKSISGTRQSTLYYDGLMTMFAESIKGLKRDPRTGGYVSKNGPDIFRSLFMSLDELDLDSISEPSWVGLIHGVLTSILHHTDSTQFKGILDVVMELSRTSADNFVERKTVQDLHRLLTCARMLGIVTGVRMGSRVQEWTPVLESLYFILKQVQKELAVITKYESVVDLWKCLVLSVSITIQFAPMESLIPFSSKFLESLTKEPLAKYFLTFCSYLSESGPDRFNSLAKPYFQKFIAAHWSDADNGDTLCVLLPTMVSSGVLPDNTAKGGFNLPQSWQAQIVSKFEGLEVKPFPEQASAALYDPDPKKWVDRCLPKYNALLNVLECTSVHPSTNARIAEILLRKLKLALRPDFSAAPEEAHFIVGRGFSAILRMIQGAGEVDKSLRPLLHAKVSDYGRLPDFLEALLDYERSLSPSQIPTNESVTSADDPMIATLISNLSTDSNGLRLRSLQLLEHFFKLEHPNSTSEAISLMIRVEQTPVGPQTARAASMCIRKLAVLYSGLSKSSWLIEAIPSFCFGMFNVRLAEIQNEATVTLGQISQSTEGEKIVAKLAFAWLKSPSWKSSAQKPDQTQTSGLTDFECSNLIRLDGLAGKSILRVTKARDAMLENFALAQHLVDEIPPSARSQALRVLAAAPAIAEKRSKILVPMFLSWADRKDQDDEEVQIDTGDDSDTSPNDWTRVDQKLLLGLFGLFKNSRSLYKAEEVYSSLLQLLANGDLEIQKSALKAILTWKNTCIKPYEENLLRLLDEDRFKEEVPVLLQRQTNEHGILQNQILVQAEHRADLNPILLRLLYGRAISRRGIASGRQGPEARRLAVLRNLDHDDFQDFLDIAIGDLKEAHLSNGNDIQNWVFDTELLSVHRQIGLMNMMEVVLKELGEKSKPLTSKITSAVLYCLIYSSRLLLGEPFIISSADLFKSEALARQSKLNKLRTIRQAALKCLDLLFRNSGADFDWNLYVPLIVKDVVLPRLDKLPIETAEGISGLLRIFNTWSKSTKTALFFTEGTDILPKIAECLSPPKSKDEVKLFVLEIISNLIKLTTEIDGSHVKELILSPNMDSFLISIGTVLRSKVDISKLLLERCVETVSELAPHVSTSTQAHSLVNVSIFLLDQPSRRVNPRTKSGLLRILEHFVPLYELQNDEQLKDALFTTITRLFGFFTDRASREVLSRVLKVYSEKDPVIGEVADLCMDLNSFLEGKKAQLGTGGDNEADFNRRLMAYNTINAHAQRAVPFSPRQWMPLLYNMLFYIRNDEALSVLSMNSSDSTRHFIDACFACESVVEKAAFKDMILNILIPAILKGAREPSELVRQEYVRVMGHLVRTFPDWAELNDMHSLLAGEDELESSFFNNILTVGKGRQSSALTQLSTASEEGHLGSKNVGHFLIPLVEHFIFAREEGSNDAHNLAAEATTTIGVLTKSLEWPQARALLKRFISYIKERPELTKQIIRLLGRVTDGIAAAAAEELPEEETLASQKEGLTSGAEEKLEGFRIRSTLSLSMPTGLKLAEDITKNILPPLTAYIRDKDESTVSLRVPVAIIIVRLLKLLPQEQLNELLPPVLTDICHILRSKAQEARDMTRDTLTKICVLIGPSCFGFVLKELRSALARGSQLHILSYTMHSILVACIPQYSPGDLDYCLPSIVRIIMDDIFGPTGQEKDAEEYGSKMKEVKSSMSHDSMELIARTATLNRLTVLVKPIQDLLMQKLNIKIVRKIDELLNRISTGLLMNPAAASRDSLIFCYEVIKEASAALPEKKPKLDHKLKKYLIQPGAKKSNRGSTTVYDYKLIRFALDVLRVVLKKHNELQTMSNLSGFIPMLQDAMDGEEEVRTSCFRLLTTIVKKVPLKYDDDESIYTSAVGEAGRSINRSANTMSDISQSALKFISAVLRDRKEIPVKDKAVDDILIKLKADMDEPEHRHVTFNFLRAVLDSKVETAVVYDTLDYVGTIMVQNSDDDTRKLARGAYFQFLSEYPQLQRRWAKQLNFIATHLEYKGKGGRLSILALILLLLMKSSDEKLQEVCEKFFMPLSMTYQNDDNDECKQVAGELLKVLFTKADEKRLPLFLTHVRHLLNNNRPVSALKIYGLYYESQNVDSNMIKNDGDVSIILGVVTGILESIESSDPNYRHQLLAALNLSSILVSTFPEIILSSANEPLWKLVPNCLSYPDAKVKLSAAKLVGVYIKDFARANQSGLEGLPLQGSYGLKLKGNYINDAIRRLANMFNTPELNTGLAQCIYENLMLLGLVAGANNLLFKGPQSFDADSEDEDEKTDRSALEYLFSRLGYNVRKETTPPARAPALIPKTFSLNVLEALVSTSRLDSTRLLPCLQAILLPLHHLTDDSIPVPYSTDEVFKTDYEALKTTAKGLMETLKAKVGTKEYSEAILQVRKGITERRMARSSKRKIEAVSQPERHGIQKKKKVERKKERRKEKGQEHSMRRKEH